MKFIMCRDGVMKWETEEYVLILWAMGTYNNILGDCPKEVVCTIYNKDWNHT